LKTKNGPYLSGKSRFNKRTMLRVRRSRNLYGVPVETSGPYPQNYTALFMFFSGMKNKNRHIVARSNSRVNHKNEI